MLIFFGAVTILLVIVCTNLAGLMLARAAARRKTFAMRAALGASRFRIVRGLLAESMLLSLLGGVAGIAVAYTVAPLLRAQNFIYLPRAEAIAVNWQILWFALGVSILAGILFGLAPVLQFSRIDLYEVLKTGSGETSLESRWSLRSFLVAGEIALSLVLLTGAGLLTRSLIRVLNTDPGYNTSHLLTFWITLQQNRYNDEQDSARVTQEILQDAGRIPGVMSVGLTTCLPPSGWEDDGGFVVVKHPPTDKHRSPATYIDAVSPGYFQTIGLRLIRGRLFTGGDNWENAPKSVIISRTLASRFFGGEDPIGQHEVRGGRRKKSVDRGGNCCRCAFLRLGS